MQSARGTIQILDMPKRKGFKEVALCRPHVFLSVPACPAVNVNTCDYQQRIDSASKFLIQYDGVSDWLFYI